MKVIKRTKNNQFYILAKLDEIFSGKFTIKGVDPEIDKLLEDGYLPSTGKIGVSGDSVLMITAFTKRKKTYNESPDLIDILVYMNNGVRSPIRGLRDIPVYVADNKKAYIGEIFYYMYTKASLTNKEITPQKIYETFVEFVKQYNMMPPFLLIDDRVAEKNKK